MNDSLEVLYFITLLLNAMIRSSPAYSRKKMNDSLEHAVLYSVIILVHISPSPIYPIYIHEAQNISTPKKPGKMHVPPF
jgi:hypothetical protein